MTSEYRVGSLRIVAASGWLDVTNDIDAENPPFTLAKSDGAGVIQFSTASHQSGKLPEIKLENLKELLADFALSRELGRGADAECSKHPLLKCAQSYNNGSQFVRVWYCSNGRDVVLVTYACERGVQQAELPDCEKMIESLEFV